METAAGCGRDREEGFTRDPGIGHEVGDQRLDLRTDTAKDAKLSL